MENTQPAIEPPPIIDGLELYDLLTKKGIKNFHHANTVKTSLSFIKEGALLSRDYVERNGLIQTEQYTDDKDKRLGIWDAVFLDGLDLHRKFGSRNKYGPILFHIELDVLRHLRFSKIRVTKSNPDSWAQDKKDFYESIEGVDKDYRTGTSINDGRIMFLFDSPELEISLQKYCNRIVIDDPFVQVLKDGTIVEIGELVKKTIGDALKEKGLEKIEIEMRHADPKTCGCMSEYPGLYKVHREVFGKLFSKTEEGENNPPK